MKNEKRLLCSNITTATPREKLPSTEVDLKYITNPGTIQVPLLHRKERLLLLSKGKLEALKDLEEWVLYALIATQDMRESIKMCDEFNPPFEFSFHFGCQYTGIREALGIVRELINDISDEELSHKGNG